MNEDTQHNSPEERRFAREKDLLDAILDSEWERLRRRCEEPSDEDWE